MIGRVGRQRNAQKTPQRQTVGTAPRNSTLRLNAFEVSHEQHAKIDAWWNARTALSLGVVLLAQTLHPRIEARTVQVGPALPLITGLIGWELYGLGGAIYSIVLLVMLLALSAATSTSDDGADVVTADA